jgi:hypothetical protein
VAGLCLTLALTGCKAKEAFDAASISKDLDKNGTTDLMKKVADDKYDAPADGKLTEAQVQMYLKVREHEKAIAQVAKKEAQQHADNAKKAGEKSLAGLMEGFKTMGSVADLLTADIRAAKDLGYNTQEYLWVKSQIMAVSTAAIGEKMAQAGAAAFEQMRQQTQKAYDEATDDNTKKMYKETLDGLDKQIAESKANQEQQDPAVAYNKQIVSKYESALNAFAQEMGKWEDKPGEVQKGVEDWNKQMDKTITDAKKGKS